MMEVFGVRILLTSIVAIFFLIGCAATPKMNRLSVGMTKAEVITTMERDPDSTSAKGEVEYLTYLLWRDFWNRSPGDYSDRFFVRLTNGRVESFGRYGDFDSAKVPETKQTIELKIK